MPVRYTSDSRPAWAHPANALSMVFPGADRLKLAILADSPLALWLMDEVSGYPQDSSGNSRHVASGSPGSGGSYRYAPLVTNSLGCVDFATGSFTVTDGAWMDTSTITVEAMMNTDSVAGGQRMLVSRDQVDGGGRIFQFRMSGGKIEAIVFVGASAKTVTGVTGLSTGTTYHVAFTMDGDKVRVYVNGALDKESVSYGAGVDTGTSGICIGSGQTTWWDGRASHIAIHSTALSESTLLAHAQAAGVA